MAEGTPLTKMIGTPLTKPIGTPLTKPIGTPLTELIGTRLGGLDLDRDGAPNVPARRSEEPEQTINATTGTHTRTLVYNTRCTNVRLLAASDDQLADTIQPVNDIGTWLSALTVSPPTIRAQIISRITSHPGRVTVDPNSTDHGQAIRDAIQAVRDLQGVDPTLVGILYFPAGTYWVAPQEDREADDPSSIAGGVVISGLRNLVMLSESALTGTGGAGTIAISDDVQDWTTRRWCGS